MVRRWSCITLINDAINTYTKFSRVERFHIFRGAVKFKKFIRNKTKFKRYQLRKIKHHTNWLIYINIFKYWIEDFRFSRHHSRFQYLNRLFVNNYIVSDANRIRKHQWQTYAPQDQWILAALTRRFFNILGRFKNARILTGYKSAGHLHAFFPTEDITPNKETTIIISCFHKNLFAKNQESEIEFSLKSLFLLNFEITIPYYIELYKLLITLWYQQCGKK